MDLKDFNLKLDRRGLISLTQDDSLFYYMKRIGKYIPAFIYSNDSKVFLSLFIPNAKIAGEIMTYLKVNGAKEWKDSFVLTRRINNVAQLKIIGGLIKIPTVVSNHVYIEDGTMHFDFRFHHRYLEDVSSALVEYTANFEKTRILDFGKCDGLAAVLNRIRKNIELTEIEWRVPITDELKNQLKSFGNCTVETENLQTSSDNFRVVVYGEPESKGFDEKNVEVVSHEEGVYRMEVRHPTLLAVRNKLNEEAVPRVAYFFRAEGDHVMVSAWVPSYVSEEYLRILLGVARENPSYGITLISSRKMNDDSPLNNY